MLLIFPRSLSFYLILIGVSIAAYYFLKQLVSKYIQRSKAKKLIALLATILIITTFCIFYLFAFTSYGESIEFDKSHWDAKHHNRFNMANDIIDSEMLIGKDTNQVKQILGIPESGNPTISAWYYYMGWGRGGFGFVMHELAVKFDNGKVSKVAEFKIWD